MGLVLCRVLTVYSKGGGNHGKHGYAETVTAITAASNIAVQMYQYQGIGIRKFTEKPLMSHAFSQLLCFNLIPSSSFLCVLSEPPLKTEGGLVVSQADIDLFKALKAQPTPIANAIKEFKKRKASTVSDEAETTEDDI
ncbi:hypothetical protein CPC08DRAFT_712887 [Agrocybe pediades]|nr:hypothetical protein CPC08DRAFT_712887 [Agrocybe pediades]